VPRKYVHMNLTVKLVYQMLTRKKKNIAKYISRKEWEVSKSNYRVINKTGLILVLCSSSVIPKVNYTLLNYGIDGNKHFNTGYPNIMSTLN
jgi:hypothetical protein